MAVIAHFICNGWKLHEKAIIISFFKVNGHKRDDIENT
jgi:hypothetical protein